MFDPASAASAAIPKSTIVRPDLGARAPREGTDIEEHGTKEREHGSKESPVLQEVSMDAEPSSKDPAAEEETITSHYCS